MPLGYLRASQAREYGRFPDVLTPDQWARYFYLDDADRAFVAVHRGDHNRLGIAVQLGSLRMLGTFPEDQPDAPVSTLRFNTRQLSLTEPEELIAEYARNEGPLRLAPARGPSLGSAFGTTNTLALAAAALRSGRVGQWSSWLATQF